MFKKLFSALLFITVICCGCGKKEPVMQDDLLKIKERDQLIVGVKVDTPPFGYLDKQGKNIGFDIDLAKLITKKLLNDENKLILVPVNPSNRIMKLSADEVDMIIATMSITPNRQMIVNFSAPYHMAGQAILIKSTSKITSIAELSNKKIIIVFGSTVEKTLRSHYPNAQIIGYKTYPEAVNALKSGVADAMIADDTILMGFAMNDKSIKLLPKRYSKEPYAIAFRKTEEAETLMKTVDDELKKAYHSGEIKNLKEKWHIN